MKISVKKAGSRAYRDIAEAPVSNRQVQLRLANVPAHIAVGATDSKGNHVLVQLGIEEAEQVAKDVAEFHAREAQS